MVKPTTKWLIFQFGGHQIAFIFCKGITLQSDCKLSEAPFLFKGVPTPQSFDLSEDIARDIEAFMKGQNSEYYSDLRLHDLEQPYLDAYESGIRMYNDMVEKRATRIMQM